MTQFIIRVYDVMEHAFKLNEIQNLYVGLKYIKLKYKYKNMPYQSAKVISKKLLKI